MNSLLVLRDQVCSTMPEASVEKTNGNVVVDDAGEDVEGLRETYKLVLKFYKGENTENITCCKMSDTRMPAAPDSS